MGILDKLLGKEDEIETVNIEECLDEDESDAITPPAEFYVKKIPLRNEGDAELVARELKGKNIIILNIAPLAKQPKRLKKIVMKLKQFVDKINGDIAKITETYIILTPEKIKIAKAKKE